MNKVDSAQVFREDNSGRGDEFTMTMQAGFEPVGNFDATTDGHCTCDFCQGWRAANALQNDGSMCRDLALIGSDLQQVIAVWSKIPVVMQRAIMALIGTDNQTQF
jgi:hypothetical protein